MGLYYISLYIFSYFEPSSIRMITIIPKQCITATIEDIAIDIVYVGELEIHTTLTDCCATFRIWSGPLLIALYLALTAKALDTPGMCYCMDILQKCTLLEDNRTF